MADISVRNDTTGAMGGVAAKRSRYEKAEVAYGKIPAAAYDAGDTLVFNDIPMKELIHARIIGNNVALEVFHGADLSDPLDLDVLNDGDPADISYVVTYIRGTGSVNSGTVAGSGALLQVTVASGASS